VSPAFDFIPYAIPFRRPVVTARGRWAVRRGYWLRVRDADGWIGLGEVAPPMGRHCPVAEMLDPMSDPSGCLPAAFELADLDIEGQRAGRPIAALLCEEPRPRVQVNALILSTGIEETAAEAVDSVVHGYRTLKLKVATGSPEHDVQRIREVRARVGDQVRIRIDANGGWDEETAVQVLGRIDRYHVEYVEDPVPGDARIVRSRVAAPIAADVRDAEQARTLIRMRTVDFLILKPMWLGGIRATREIACEAIDAGIGVVVTSGFESAVGVAGAVHLAASLPGPERAHGLATVGLLEDQPVRGLPAPREGVIQVPWAPGLGVTLVESGA